MQSTERILELKKIASQKSNKAILAMLEDHQEKYPANRMPLLEKAMLSNQATTFQIAAIILDWVLSDDEQNLTYFFGP